MNKIQTALTAFFFAASFMVFGVAHAQVGESSGVPFIEQATTTFPGNLLNFTPTPANELRVIKMVNCTATFDSGDLVSVILQDAAPVAILPAASIDLPWVPTVPTAGHHSANSNNNVLFYIENGFFPRIYINNAKGQTLQSARCQLIGYDVPSPALRLGGTTD